MSTLIQNSIDRDATIIRTRGVDTIHSQAISDILAGDSKASNLPKVSKVGDISQNKKLFSELEKALEKEEMDDKAFVDKLGSEIEYSCKSTLTLI